MSKTKQKQTQVLDRQDIAQQLLIDEAIENMHGEQLSKFWKKYKYLFYILIFAIVASVAGFETIKARRHANLLATSDTYEQAAVLNAKGQAAESLAKYETLEDATTNYKHLAVLRRAGILFEENKNSEALSLLRTLSENPDAPEVIRTIALFAVVSRQANTQNPEELRKMISPYLVASNPFYGTAVELDTTLLIRQNKNKEAVSQIDQALTVSSLPQKTKERLAILKNTLSGK